MVNAKQIFRERLRTFFAIFIPIVVSAPPVALADGLGDIVQQNVAFDQQMQGMVQQQQMQNQAAQQQLIQDYIAQNGPRLQQEYQQYIQMTGAQIPFEQFVYYHIMTAGGTNAGPALQQQQQQNFRALQNANRTVQEGWNSYNQGYWQNQQTQGNMHNRYSNEAIMENAPYVNPQTGEEHNLPYTAPGPEVYRNQQGTFDHDEQGNYYQVDPQGYRQQLEPTDPNRAD